MPKSQTSSPATGETEHFSAATKQVTERVAIERACRLIDRYIREMWPTPHDPDGI